MHLVEFNYNNGYQTSLKMSHFEVMYGRICKLPLSRDHVEDRLVLGPNMLREMKVLVTRLNKI